MRVDISQILGQKGASLPFNLTFHEENTENYPDVVDFLEPVEIEGMFQNIDGLYVLHGHVKTKVSLSCSRCLAPVAVDIFFQLDEKYTNTGIEEEEIETFSGNHIDLAPVIRKGIEFHLPMKVLCKEDCKGLCPVCGKDLNEGDCNCDTTYINPKFESLRSLFKVDEEV